MHTIMVVAGGFMLLGVCLLAGRAFGGPTPGAIADAAKYFIPLWLVAALVIVAAWETISLRSLRD
jgi:hypothetical protein